jgi:hypothetical protein
MQEAVKAAFENMDFANFDFMGVSKKVDELSKKVDNL